MGWEIAHEHVGCLGIRIRTGEDLGRGGEVNAKSEPGAQLLAQANYLSSIIDERDGLLID